MWAEWCALRWRYCTTAQYANYTCVGRRGPILNIASKMACGCGYLARFSRYRWLSTRLLWARLQSSLVPAVSVDDERVQELLSQLTGLDLDKVFSPRQEPLQPPTYKLMTLNELEKVLPRYHAAMYFTFPDVGPWRVCQRSKEFASYATSTTRERAKGSCDWSRQRISWGHQASNGLYWYNTAHGWQGQWGCAIPHNLIHYLHNLQDRQIVVCEIDGTLREANWDERDRMCQMFFPKLGRKMWLPMMLQPEQLPEVLSLGHHLTVLDCVCVQCAPDSAEYIRVWVIVCQVSKGSHCLWLMYNLKYRFIGQYTMTLRRRVCMRCSGPRGTSAVWCGTFSPLTPSLAC